MNNTKIYNSNLTDHFFQAAFSVNMVFITFHEKKIKILLEQKKEAPFEYEWSLPGKMILPDEDSDKAIDDLMISFIGESSYYKKQLATYSDLGRHPMGRIINFTYYGLAPYEKLDEINSGTLKWCGISEIPELIIDHNQIIEKIFYRFRKGLLRHPLVFEILPEKFIISDMITIYEQIFSQKLDVRNLRKKLLASGLLTPTGEMQINENFNGRPAQLFTLSNLEPRKQEKIQFELSIYLTRMLKYI